MLMPDKLALEFYQFDVLPVQLAHDPGVPVVVEEGELLTQVHLGDRSVSEDASDELPLADRIVKKIRDALCDDLALECDILLQEHRVAPQPIPEGPQLQNLWRVNGDYVYVEPEPGSIVFDRADPQGSLFGKRISTRLLLEAQSFQHILHLRQSPRRVKDHQIHDALARTTRH